MASSGDDTKIVGDTGRRKPPRAGMGRPKGSPNKITKTLKEALELAFSEVGAERYLIEQATLNPQAFMTLLAKLLPAQIQAEVSTADASSVLPDGLVLMPKSFPCREAWDTFFDWAKRQPDALVIHGGAPPPSGFGGDIFPIARRVNGGWVIGGIPSASEMTSYDLDFAAPPGMTLPPAY